MVFQHNTILRTAILHVVYAVTNIHRLAYTHELTETLDSQACTLYHNKMCPLHAAALDKNSEAETNSHTLTYYIFLWIIEGTLYMIFKKIK